MATNAPGSIDFLSTLTFSDRPPHPPSLAPSLSALYLSRPGSGILGTHFHVKLRGSAQGCDATALFPLRGEEPCAVRPIPVHSKKTATFSHCFPSSSRQLKTIPECLWIWSFAKQATSAWSEWEREMKYNGEKGYRIGLFVGWRIQAVRRPLKTNKRDNKAPLCSTDAGSKWQDDHSKWALATSCFISVTVWFWKPNSYH